MITKAKKQAAGGTKSAPVRLPESVIDEVTITGLFGDRDVSIGFSSGARVLVGDNGNGKTTVLNCLYYALAGQFHRLAAMPFETITLKFATGQIVSLAKAELPDPYSWSLSAPSLADYRAGFATETDFIESIKLFKETNGEDQFVMLMYQKKFGFKTPINGYLYHRELTKVWDQWNRSGRSGGVGEVLEAKRKQVLKAFPSRIIFLPTYRRVEEEISNLGLHLGQEESRRATGDSHIFFGMHDVEQLFQQLRTRIQQGMFEAFRVSSGKMVDQLIQEGFQPTPAELVALQDAEALDVVLNRLGKKLGERRRAELNAFLQGTEQTKTEIGALAYVLQNLLDVYKKQRPLEQQIRKFIDVANHYLTGKRLQFNDVTAELSLVTASKVRLRLQNLSSGEKQLISILSRLYLADDTTFAVIVDEPELSLSIEWQRSLLPDILRSEKCVFLLAATHSPFIFENELESVTSVAVVRNAQQ